MLQRCCLSNSGRTYEQLTSTVHCYLVTSVLCHLPLPVCPHLHLPTCSYKQQFRRLHGLLAPAEAEPTALKGSALCYNAATGHLVSYNARQRVLSVLMADGSIRSEVGGLCLASRGSRGWGGGQGAVGIAHARDGGGCARMASDAPVPGWVGGWVGGVAILGDCS